VITPYCDAKDSLITLLKYIGEDPDREGLKETPDRVLRSYSELFSGYKKKPEDVFKCFEDGACDELVLLKNIEFVSFCEHHMLPFFGTAHIGYVPEGKIIGISKLARLLEIYSRRLQVQERLTEQVTKDLMKYLQPKGAACVLEATHSCMTCRGVGKQNSRMVTSSLLGVFRDNSAARAELFQLIRS
jgi:GTP cyclohydrolase I